MYSVITMGMSKPAFHFVFVMCACVFVCQLSNLGHLVLKLLWLQTLSGNSSVFVLFCLSYIVVHVSLWQILLLALHNL